MAGRRASEGRSGTEREKSAGGLMPLAEVGLLSGELET
ncbi:hypothetical protein R70006_01975 [Paraburkholderia domus]|nr:hypothetical protein R70006_01975 [Paraburkholderia domus]